MQEQQDYRKQVDIPSSQFQEGYQQTPLREFIGDFTNYEAERDEQYKRVRVTLQFSNIQVIQSTEPYPFPIAQLVIPFSQRKRSAMGFLVDSIDKLIPGGSLSSILNKRVRMKMLSENYGRWRGETEDRIRDAWNVVELVGQETVGVNAVDVAIALAVGQPYDNLSKFHQQAFQNPVIKKDRTLLGKILNKTFIEEMIEMGALEVSADGVLVSPTEE